MESSFKEAFPNFDEEFFSSSTEALSIKANLCSSSIKPLTNDELAFVYDFMHIFTDEEIANIPNVQSMGSKHYFVKESMEIMLSLKMVHQNYPSIPFRDLIRPHLRFRTQCLACQSKRHHGLKECSDHRVAKKRKCSSQ